MKSYLKLGIPLILLFLLSCYSAQIRSSAQDATATPPVNSNAKPSPEIAETPKDETLPAMSFFEVEISPFEKKDKTISVQIEEVNGWADIKEGAEFDIVNEYGYLGKGKLRFVKKEPGAPGYWLADVSKKDMRPNINELCKQRMQEREKESPRIPALGVYPSLSERSKTKTAAAMDMSEGARAAREAVYRSLPKEVIDRADVYGEKGSLEYPNSWADLDGDGKIDYASIRVTCAELPNSHCIENLFLHSGKWIKIPVLLK